MISSLLTSVTHLICRDMSRLGQPNAVGVWHESAAEKQQLGRQSETRAEGRAASEKVWCC